MSASSTTLLRLFRSALDALRVHLDAPTRTHASWSQPFIELHYPIPWHPAGFDPDQPALPFQDLQVIEQADPTLALGDRLARACREFPGLQVLSDLTRHAAVLKRRGSLYPILPEPLVAQLAKRPAEERETTLDELLTPFSFDASPPSVSDSLPGPIEHTGTLSNRAPFLATFTGQVRPLLLDEDERQAHFPVIVGLRLAGDPATASRTGPPKPTDPSTWSVAERQALWEGLHAALSRAAGPGALDAPGPPDFPYPLQHRPRPEVLRSIMSPVSIPQTPIKASHFAALQRGIGQAFSGYQKVPDLDLDGQEAVEEAQRLFWPVLEGQLEREAPGWRKTQEEGKAVYTLPGFDERRARAFWLAFTKALNKDNGTAEGGPGIRVADPDYRATALLKDGQPLHATQLVLWPEASLKDRDGWIIHPVRFRRTSSPAYLKLLDRHKGERFFADGWLWQPHGDRLEGFRIGGLPMLLFPEGREAIARLEARKIQDLDTELNRIFYQPSLFHDQDQLTQIRLQDALRRAKNRIRDLQTYDWSDIYCCLFEAFSRQKDAWFQERVMLPDGREVETRPFRVLCLSPLDLRLRLDPSRTWGDNWRAEMLRRLEALATFERQTRDLDGNVLDTGDRLIQRIIDGRQGVQEGKAPDDDPGLGLTRILKSSRAFPVDAFFLAVSPELMANLFTVVTNQKGLPAWGLDAVEATRTKALAAGKTQREVRELATDTRKKVQKPFFEHSPRLQSVANLHQWGPQRKHLASVLLMERINKAQRIDSDDYHPCNGRGGAGYKVATWMSKAGYPIRKGPRGTVQAFGEFLEDLRVLTETLGLRLRLRRGPQATHQVLEILRAYREAPRDVLLMTLQAFLPTDLEDRLREILAGARIEAIDSHELPAPLFRASAEDRLTPAALRAARKRAGWGQDELARRLGLNQANISRWEHGKKPIPEKYEGELRQVLREYLDPTP